jgi:hypothetical protein
MLKCLQMMEWQQLNQQWAAKKKPEDHSEKALNAAAE